MTNRDGIAMFLVAAVIAAAAACKLVPPPEDPGQEDPGHEEWLCERAPARIWVLANGSFLVRNERYQFLMLPAGLGCHHKREIVTGLPDDCRGIDCGQFEIPYPDGVVSAFEALENVEPAVYEAKPSVIVDGVDTRIRHWITGEHEMLQASRELDLRTVLGVHRDGGDVQPFSGTQIGPALGSIIECVPCTCDRGVRCSCLGGASPPPRPEQVSDLTCPPCPEDRAAACAQADPQSCDYECYCRCCQEHSQSCGAPDA